MSRKTYRLKQSLFGWAKGETIIYDTQWGEFTRQKTRERFDTRGNIRDGEIAMLLGYVIAAKLTSVMEEL